MRRWIRGLSALLVLVLGVVAAPMALLAWGRYPQAWSWSMLLHPDDGGMLLILLTVAGWVAWAAFASSTLLELIRIASGNRVRVRVPSLGGLQAASASLLFAVVSLAATVDGGSVAQASPAVSVAQASPAVSVVNPAVAVPSAENASPVPQDPGTWYEVAAGDDLWTIAGRLLGHGTRWREVVAANPDVLAEPTRQLVAGTRLRLPEAPDAEAPPGPRRIQVEKGDTLSGLAREHLGRASAWPRLERANPDLIKDPDHIEVGWRLTLPAAARPVPESQVAEVEVRHQLPERGQQVPEATGEPSAFDPQIEGGVTAPPGSTVSPGSAEAPDSADAARPTVPPGSTVSPGSAEAPDSADAARPPSSRDSAPPTGSPTAPTGQGEAEATQDAVQAEAPEQTKAILGGLGALCAAAIVGGVEARRSLQLRARPLGRRITTPPADLVRFRTALGRRQRPDRLTVLDRSLRAIGHHAHLTGVPLPALAEIVASEDGLVFRWAEPAGDLPPGFAGTTHEWTLPLPEGPELPWAEVDHPCPYPALITLGCDEAGGSVLVDLERSRVLGVASDDPELQQASLAAMAVELSCSPWAAELCLAIVGPDARLAQAAGGDRVRHIPEVTRALTDVRALVDERRHALADDDFRALRVDPERAEAVTPVIFLFTEPLDHDTQRQLDAWLEGSRAGVAAILATESQAPAQWQVLGHRLEPQGLHLPSQRLLRAQTIPEATRDAIAGLFEAVGDPTTTAAPWWSGVTEGSNVRALHPRPAPPEETVDIVRLRREAPASPLLMLIGPIDLVGAAGGEPPRSRQQLLEMCGWLIEHPGQTASAMAAALLVAEGTRRSNMSRLRAWLGADSEGRPYLPEAYSGRIRLQPEVTSDWHRLQVLVGPGVDKVSESALVAALDLVRGAPLADAAPGQWRWAEELRTDIASVIRDAGLVLVDRALASGDVDLARWAAGRALVAAPEDELLLGARIRTEHRAGNRADVERLVARLTQQARSLGVDLMPETVILCQEVIEGRPRARQA